jgi:hypothetical protein
MASKKNQIKFKILNNMQNKRLFYFAGHQPDLSKITPDELEQEYARQEDRRFRIHFNLSDNGKK